MRNLILLFRILILVGLVWPEPCYPQNKPNDNAIFCEILKDIDPEAKLVTLNAYGIPNFSIPMNRLRKKYAKISHLQDQTLRNYAQIGSRPRTTKLQPDHALSSCSRWWLDEKEWMTAFKVNRWDTFHQKYPEANGVVKFGVLAYNDGHSQALVDAWRGMDYTAGRTWLFVLDKTPNGWKLAKRVTISSN